MIVERKRQRGGDAEVKASVAEQSRLLNLLIAKVVYDGNDSTIAVTFRPTGIKERVDSKEGGK